MHIVDDVQGVHINARQPLHHIIECVNYLIIFKHVAVIFSVLRPHLFSGLLIHAAVEGIEQALRQVGAGAEELHFLTDAHGRNAAGDAVVVSVHGAHQVVVFVLDGRGLDGHLRTVTLKADREPGGPEHGQVRLRCRTQVGQGMQVAEGHLRRHMAAVHAHACQGLGDPYRVAGEQIVVFRRTREFDDPQLHDEVIHEFLDLLLREGSKRKVALRVDIQEGGGTSQRHGRSVLFLHRRKIAEIGGLDGFLHVGGGTGNVTAVGGRHFLHQLQRHDLLGKLLS